MSAHHGNENGHHQDTEGSGAVTAQDDLARENKQVKGWRFGAEVFESHTGAPQVLPKHFHDTYQIAITTRDPGEYVCDGRTWIAPPGSIIIFHPGDVHSTAGPCVRHRDDASRLIYVEPARLAEIASSIADGEAGAPVFDDRVILNDGFIRRFSETHALSATNAPTLEKESRLLSLLAQLILGFAAGPRAPGRLERSRKKALLVSEYVHAHYRDNLSLSSLAELAHTSPYHLNRLFAKELGMPPHAFQTHVRVERAKHLLLRGASVAEAASSTGFFDQSHLTRYFKRIVGVSPRSYVAAR